MSQAPNIDNVTGNVYALSDIHGCIEIYNQVKAFLQPNDIVLFLGDAGDRGPQGWECIKAIYNDPQFIYLMGNHEDMLFHAMCGRRDDVDLCWYNGGRTTLAGWNDESEEVSAQWYDDLRGLPIIAIYHNQNGDIVHMSHSGWINDHIHDAYAGARLQLIYALPSWETQKCLWNRMGLYDNRWFYGENEFIVHGHSPIPLCFEACDTREELNEWGQNPNIMHYCEGHKIDIDCGTHYTGAACLLNLDTWDEHYFFTDERAQ